MIKKVYFAGKVKKEGFRQRLMWARIMSDGEIEVEINGGKLIYAGPNAIACDHGCWHYKNSRGEENDLVHGISLYGQTIRSEFDGLAGCPPDNALSNSQAVERCLTQIRNCDAVYAYIDSTDCYGTITELGYASAIGKPIYLDFRGFYPKKATFTRTNEKKPTQVNYVRLGYSVLLDSDDLTCVYPSLAELNISDITVNNEAISSYYERFSKNKDFNLIADTEFVYLYNILATWGTEILNIESRKYSKKHSKIIETLVNFLIKDLKKGAINYLGGQKIELILKDEDFKELWFIRNLPNATTIPFDDDLFPKELLYYPPIYSVKDRLRSLGRATVNEDSIKEIGAKVAKAYKKRNKSNPHKKNIENKGMAVPINLYSENDLELIDKIIMENSEPDYKQLLEYAKKECRDYMKDVELFCEGKTEKTKLQEKTKNLETILSNLQLCQQYSSINYVEEE